MEKQTVKIEMRNPESLIPYENNARTHSDEQLDELVKSIKTFGFNDPIELSPDGTILSGHARALAAVKAGLEHVPTVTLQGMDENALKAYILAANRIAQNAGWDIELLKIEFEDLLEHDFDITLTGFTDEEIESYLNPSENADTKKDLSDSIVNRLIVEINCNTETEQEKLYNELKNRGFECRLLTL